MSIPDAVLSAFIEAKGAREATKAIGDVQDALRAARDEAVLATNAVNRFGRTRGIAVLDVDSAKARAQVKAAEKDVRAFADGHAAATLAVNGSGVTNGVKAASSQLALFDREHATAVLDADVHAKGFDIFAADVGGAKTSVREAIEAHLGAELDSANFTRFQAEIERAKASARQREAFKAALGADFDSKAFTAYERRAREASSATKDTANSFDGLHSSKSKTDKLIDKNVGTFGKLSQSIRGTGTATSGLGSSLGPLSGGLSGMAAAGLFAGTALLGIAGPAVAVVAALAPLVGLAAGAAGGLVAAAQGFGVFKLATIGVLDALKEQTKLSAGAGGAAASQAGQEVAAARAIAGAQDGLRSARQATAQASRAVSEATRTEHQAIAALGPAYTEARQRLRDMRDAVIGTNLSLKDAQNAAQDARRALADLLGGPSPRVLADAHLAVADALRSERQAAEGLADATKALNDLLAPPDVLSLADAHDAVADATRGETKAQLALNRQITATNAVLANPASSSDQQAQARLDLADAENGVGDATRATAHAQEALSKLETPATADQVARARGRVQDAEAGVAAATLSTSDARSALAGLESGPSSDAIARARLALAQAEQAVSTATKDSVRAAREYGAAEAQGLAQSPSVIAAREAIRSATMATADAERSLVNAQHAEAIAAKGVSQAQADAARSAITAGAGVENLSKKFDALPPAAQTFVRALQSMKPKLDELRQAAAGGFFPGATAGLQAASGAFGAIKQVVGETAVVLGDAARKSGELVGSPAFSKDIQTIGGNNAKVLGTLGEALRHVISAFRNVLVAAGPLTQWLADVANKWALNASEAAKAGRETGKLAAFFESTRATAQRLGSILSSLAGGLFGIGKVGAESGRGILASIDAAAKRFDEWANSVKGQNSIREFFQKTREIAAALLPALGNLASGFAVLALRLLPVTSALKLLGPYADEAVIAFVAYKVAVTGVIIASKAFAAAAAISAFATGGWVTAAWALNAALVANPIGLVVLAIAALVAGLILAYKQSETFRNIIDGAFAGVATAFGWITAAASAVFSWLSDHWPLLLGILTGPIGVAVNVIVSSWDTLKAATMAVWGAITGFLSGAWTAILSTAGTVWTAIREAILTPVRAARDLMVDVVTGIANRLAAGWLVITTAASLAWNTVRDLILTPVRAARDLMVEVVAGIGNRLTVGWDAIKSGAVAAWGFVRENILTPVREARDAIGDVITGIANRVSGGFDTIVKGAREFAGTVKDAIVGGIKDAANLVVGLVNDIIGVLNKIPGVDIAKVKELAEGGVHAKGGPGAKPGGFAHGGAFARTGGFVNSPITLMGEEAPCIARGTMIVTERGLRQIEKVRVGERVLTRNGYRPVVWSGITRRDAEVLRITSVDGDNVLCTPDHRVWAMSGGEDGDGDRDCVGGGPVRGRGMLSSHEGSGQESVRLDASLYDRQGHGAALPGCGGFGAGVGSEGQRAAPQADLRGGRSAARRREEDHPGLSTVVDAAQGCEGPRAPDPHRDARSGGGVSQALLHERSQADAGEHLLAAQRVSGLSDMQARPCAGVEQGEVRNQPGACTEGARRGTRGCPQEARRPGMERASQGAEPGLVSPEEGWREAQSLRVGDWIWTLDADGGLTPARIASIHAEERIDTYDLMVAEDHEFIAGGILVHNSHPEYVIPTNPAYRGRAQMLLGQAASAIGLAQGGVYSEGEIEGIWNQAGGARSAAHTMGIIAEAESGGNTNARNPSGASGLWQILGAVVAGNLFDPIVNARNAISKSNNGRNLHPWDASRSVWGSQIGGGGGVLGAIGGALSSVGGAIGDLLSGGADAILGLLPGVGSLPDYLKGTGKYVLGKAGDYIKDQVASLVGAGGGGEPGAPGGPDGTSVYKGVLMADWVIGALKHAATKGFNGQPTSGYRSHADNVAHGRNYFSEHEGTQYPHGAVDFGGFTNGLATKLAAVAATADYKYPLLAPKGFRDDGHASGTGHYMGGVYGGGVLGSYAGGTDYVPQTGPYLLHRGESVAPAGGATVEDLIEALGNVDIYIGGERIDERIDVRLKSADRQSAARWTAGVS